MSPLFLIGYMGCGKTTLGRALAKSLGREFIDLDFYITQRYRRSVAELFAERGEEGFRELESAMLREAGEFEDVIIACGGGTPCFGDNMDYMNERGTTVWVQASLPRLVERLRRGKHKRPIIASLPDEEIPAFIERHLRSREPFYAKARRTFNGDALETKAQIAASVSAFKP